MDRLELTMAVPLAALKTQEENGTITAADVQAILNEAERMHAEKKKSGPTTSDEMRERLRKLH